MDPPEEGERCERGVGGMNGFVWEDSRRQRVVVIKVRLVRVCGCAWWSIRGERRRRRGCIVRTER